MTAPAFARERSTGDILEVLAVMPPSEGRSRYLVVDPLDSCESVRFGNELILPESKHAGDGHTDPTRVDILLLLSGSLAVALMLLGIALGILSRLGVIAQ